MQPCPAALLSSIARHPCPAPLPGTLALHPCPASKKHGEIGLKTSLNLSGQQQRAHAGDLPLQCSTVRLQNKCEKHDFYCKLVRKHFLGVYLFGR
jgi:hypothetical protein